MDGEAWWAAVHGVAKTRTWLSNFPFTFHFPALEKEMATHSSVLAWRIPGMGEPGGLPSMGSHRVGHNWSDLAAGAGAAAAWYQVWIVAVNIQRPQIQSSYDYQLVACSVSLSSPIELSWLVVPRSLGLVSQYSDSSCSFQIEILSWYQGINETSQDSIVITEKFSHIIQPKDSSVQLSRHWACTEKYLIMRKQTFFYWVNDPFW